MEYKAVMGVAAGWLLLAQVACGGDSGEMTNASQGGAATGAQSQSTPAAAKSSPSMASGLGGAPGTTTSRGPAQTASKAQAGTGTPAATSSTASAGTRATSSDAGAMPTGGLADIGSAGGGDVVIGAAGSGSADSGAAGSPSAGSGSTGDSEGSCLDGITDYDKDGPFMFEQKLEGAVNVWVPKVPAGCKVPIIHLANGTGANCLAYEPALTRMASHGFLTTCYEDPNTGSGQQSLMAFQQTLEMHPDLAAMKFGSTGHSQGGQAAFTGLQLAEAKWGDDAIYAGLAMEPASGFGIQPAMPWPQVYATIKSPMFMFSGLGTDGLVSQAWVQSAYDALSMSDEAYFWTAAGATHIPVPNGEEQEISIPWFRWKLLGDQAACKYFKSIPMMDTRWNEVASKNVQDCD